jgi:predicted RNA binding protein YcfA (HicA-like mRNA interferase family)
LDASIACRPQRAGGLRSQWKLQLPLKVRDAIKLVENDGWRLVNQEGSHRQYKHLTKKGRVTIAGHGSMDLDRKTENSILKQAGLK